MNGKKVSFEDQITPDVANDSAASDAKSDDTAKEKKQKDASSDTRSVNNMTSMTLSAHNSKWIHPTRQNPANKPPQVVGTNAPPSSSAPSADPLVTNPSDSLQRNHEVREQTPQEKTLGSVANKGIQIKPSSTRPPKMETKKRISCLLIHDSSLREFDQTKFSRTFEVTTYQANTCYALNKDNRLKNKLRNTNYECIFIHVGLQDVINNRDHKTIMKSYEELMWYLLENTKAKICFSLPTPTKNCASLNVKIIEINDALTNLISAGRAENPVHKTCLFSYSNASVAHQNIYNHGCKAVQLTDVGKLIMWSRLCDGLKKTMRLPRKQLAETSTYRRPNAQRQSNNSHSISPTNE